MGRIGIVGDDARTLQAAVQMKQIEVAIPCFEQGRFLEDAVNSVLDQEIEPLRVLVIDNGSMDNSAEAAQELARKDRRIELSLHKHNRGPHASFNEAVDWCSDGYFMILCADDILTPGSLRRASSILDTDAGLSFAYGTDLHWMTDELFPTVSDTPQAQWRTVKGYEFIRGVCRSPERYIAAGMVLVRAELQKAAGYYRASLPHTDDLEMLMRLACLGSVAITPAIQGIKRMHGQNRTIHMLSERTRDLRERVAALESFFAREGKLLPAAESLRRLGRRSISERAYWCGMKDLVRGRQTALSLFVLALTLNPLVALVPPINYLWRFREPQG
jgi:glycosyltransferase involved in cell wall biosynthesis